MHAQVWKIQTSSCVSYASQAMDTTHVQYLFIVIEIVIVEHRHGSRWNYMPGYWHFQPFVTRERFICLWQFISRSQWSGLSMWCTYYDNPLARWVLAAPMAKHGYWWSIYVRMYIWMYVWMYVCMYSVTTCIIVMLHWFCYTIHSCVAVAYYTEMCEN